MHPSQKVDNYECWNYLKSQSISMKNLNMTESKVLVLSKGDHKTATTTAAKRQQRKNQRWYTWKSRIGVQMRTQWVAVRALTHQQQAARNNNSNARHRNRQSATFNRERERHIVSINTSSYFLLSCHTNCFTHYTHETNTVLCLVK